ncbi:DUF1657 domain-containing protein [Oceanobacillus massiliensis]|uniref:DUF1657 domain-containing protein n=1 Tax=Oceanobacillus massiliensis TaxID=1465765 RepID=UPI000287BB7A|nr:DUF1657 domain-containing protein [Oceanobacillus massiliensis]
MTVGAQVKGCFSSLKSMEAGLQVLANKTQDAESRQNYSDVQKLIAEIKNDLQMQVIELSKEEPQYK